MASPSPYRDVRGAGLSGFVPLNEEHHPVSTRRQRLPALIQSRSSTALFTFQRSRLPRNDSVFSFMQGDEESDAGDERPLNMRRRSSTPGHKNDTEFDFRRTSTTGPEVLNTPHMRSMRLIGKSNPRYHWHQYWKSEEELKQMKRPIREYYERNNFLIAQYIYIDRLLDSSLPYDLIREYSGQGTRPETNLQTICEDQPPTPDSDPGQDGHAAINPKQDTKVKRTPKNIYKLPQESSPLLDDTDRESIPADIKYDEDEDLDSSSPVVTVAIYINLAANVLLLIGKIAVTILTSSLSVLASLVDAVLDFLSTAIVWVTTKLIARQDQYAYPIGRRRLEPVGVLVFSVVMITSFCQVALQCLQRLTSDDHSIVKLGVPAIAIMLSTVVIKGFCWFWCRLVKNSSVQALAQDAATDVVFNTFSIIFPLIGFYAKIWWLDALGGLLLSLFVIYNWCRTSTEHVRNLCGAAATADQRNVLLYLTMRFAKTIKSIQGLQAYHAGDKLNVEVDIVLDEDTNLRDSHDLSESLQYVLESVPVVDRAFVHADYFSRNLPSHMNQQSE